MRRKILLLGLLMTSFVKSAFVVTADFKNNEQLPTKYTCSIKNPEVPVLQWSGAPAETKSFVVIMDDPDAPGDEPYVHWVVFNIPGDATSVQGGVLGSTSGKGIGFTPACPPPGKVHHYKFTVYALKDMLDLPAGSTKREVSMALKKHVLVQSSITGTYQAQANFKKAK